VSTIFTVGYLTAQPHLLLHNAVLGTKKGSPESDPNTFSITNKFQRCQRKTAFANTNLFFAQLFSRIFVRYPNLIKADPYAIL